MLIVGDAAIKAINPKTSVDSIEVLCDPENEKKVLEELGVKQTTFMKIDEGTKLYRKGITPLLLISTVGRPYLRLLIKKNMATDNLKVAIPSINYMYLASLCNFRFKNPNSWIRIVNQVRNLEDYFYKSFITEDSIKKNLTISKFVSRYFEKAMYIDKNKITRIGFKTYSRYVLSGIISNEGNLVYRRLTLPGNEEYLSFSVFKDLNRNAKITASIQIIYLDLINEHLVPEYEITGSYPLEHKWKNLFNKSIMDFCLEENTQFRGFMQEFVLDNLDEIHNFYNAEVIRNFINLSLQNKIMKKIT